MDGEAKLITPITMENIAASVHGEGLATPDDIERLVQELYEFTADPDTLAGMPRVFQVWARKPV